MDKKGNEKKMEKGGQKSCKRLGNKGAKILHHVACTVITTFNS